MNEWLIDESVPIGETSVVESPRENFSLRGERNGPALAVRINDLIIHDTKKWFGSADIRLDTLIFHGAKEGESSGFCHPTTLRFSNVEDNDRLPIEHPGQRLYYGHPLHFLDVSIFVSRDTKDSDELSSLINSELNSDVWKSGASAVLAATAVAPQAAVIVGAVSGAAILANAAYKILKNVTGNTIGLYRTSWLQRRDRFGLGRHPGKDSFRQQDFSFWYEIVFDKEKPI